MSRTTSLLILANVLVFEIIFSMPQGLFDSAFQTFAFSSAYIIEIWRPVTSLFIHASASHLFFNMLGLYFFGRVVEDRLNERKMLLIYFLSGIAGNIAFGITSTGFAVGASGCVFGLMGFAMFTKPREIINLYVFPLPLGVISVLYAVVETMLVYYGQAMSGVAHIAHVGGLVAGILFAFREHPGIAGRSLAWLLLFLVIIVALGPVFGLIIGFGNLVLGAIDYVVGMVLYGLANVIGLFLW